MLALNQQLRQEDSNFTLSGADRVHPAANGHWWLTHQLLQHQQAQASFGELKISVADSVQSFKGNTLLLRHLTNSKVRLDLTPAGLPFLIPDTLRVVQELSLCKRYNSFKLQVSGLEEGKYKLKLDNKKLAEVTAAQLASGIDLADYFTPWHQQAKEVQKLWRKRHQLEAFVLRQAGRENPHIWDAAAQAPGRKSLYTATDSAMAKLTDRPEILEELAQLEEAARAAAQPRPVKVSIAKIWW